MSVRLTKNELKKQKDDLKRFNRYLPTLKLKQQQLLIVLQRISAEIERVKKEYQTFYTELQKWIPVFGDTLSRSIEGLFEESQLITDESNVAGVDIPVYKSFNIRILPYDLHDTPRWVDFGINAIIEVLRFLARINVLEEQHRRISEELRITIQRVNLFEKIKIPETKKHIRTIQIYLGDQQTASVVRGKITKGRLVQG